MKNHCSAFTMRDRAADGEANVIGSFVSACTVISGCSARFLPTPGKSTSAECRAREFIGRTDAGEHQKLRRIVGAAGEDHLARGVA